MNITEFLEARIAEDEAECRPMAALDDDDRSGWSIAYAQRVLAECAANRAIIEQAGEASGDRSQVIGEFCVGKAESDEAYATDPGDLILRHLAAIYADHPDYDKEWAL